MLMVVLSIRRAQGGNLNGTPKEVIFLYNLVDYNLLGHIGGVFKSWFSCMKIEIRNITRKKNGKNYRFKNRSFHNYIVNILVNIN